MTKNTTAEGPEANPFSVLGDALDAAAEAVGDARVDATASAKVAAAKVQSGISTGAYYTGYGVSYGVVFTGVFLKELLPADNAFRRGIEAGVVDGSHAGVEAAHKVVGLPSGEETEPATDEEVAEAEPAVTAPH